LADLGSAVALASSLPNRPFAVRDELRVSSVLTTQERNEVSPASTIPNIAQRVLLVASAGGHWIELHRLRDAFVGADCQFVSTCAGMTPPLGTRDVLEIGDLARDSATGALPTIRRLVDIMRAFSPDLVISTGAAPGALALLVAKVFGARTIWIDSIANSDTLSLSGRIVRPVADIRITQWAHLAEQNRSLRYFGQVL
jgi:hypothetical protein